MLLKYCLIAIVPERVERTASMPSFRLMYGLDSAHSHRVCGEPFK